MNNLSSHCGLVDAKIRASYKDLPVLLAGDNIDGPCCRSPKHVLIQFQANLSPFFGCIFFETTLIA